MTALVDTMMDDFDLMEVDDHETPEIRRADSPGWIFFDDEKETTPEDREFKALAYDWEEWKNSQKEFKEGVSEFPAAYKVVTYKDGHGLLKMIKDENGKWDLKPNPNPIVESEKMVDIHELTEIHRKNNWIIGFHKKRPKNNDIAHRIISMMNETLTNPKVDGEGLDSEEMKGLEPLSDKLYLTLRKVLQGRAKYAPGPIRGTVFRNPDGSRYENKEVNPTAAKIAFCKKHKIEDEFVSVDRVQKEGEKTSYFVVGVRKSSKEVASSYYDPRPMELIFREVKDNGDWVRKYENDGAPLIKVPESMVFSGYRLTVRELEQAIISGCDLYDDEDDAEIAGIEIEGHAIDEREITMNTGWGKEYRTISSLSDQELSLYSIIGSLSSDDTLMAQMQEAIMVRNQEPGFLHSLAMAKGLYSEQAMRIINFVSQFNPELLQFTKEVLFGDGYTEEERKEANKTQSFHIVDFEPVIKMWENIRRKRDIKNQLRTGEITRKLYPRKTKP